VMWWLIRDAASVASQWRLSERTHASIGRSYSGYTPVRRQTDARFADFSPRGVENPLSMGVLGRLVGWFTPPAACEVSRARA